MDLSEFPTPIPLTPDAERNFSHIPLDLDEYAEDWAEEEAIQSMASDGRP